MASMLSRQHPEKARWGALWPFGSVPGPFLSALSNRSSQIVKLPKGYRWFGPKCLHQYQSQTQDSKQIQNCGHVVKKKSIKSLFSPASSRGIWQRVVAGKVWCIKINQESTEIWGPQFHALSRLNLVFHGKISHFTHVSRDFTRMVFSSTIHLEYQNDKKQMMITRLLPYTCHLTTPSENRQVIAARSLSTTRLNCS